MTALARIGGMLGWGKSVAASTMGLLRPAVPGTQRDLVKIRLQRFGMKHVPFYRIVAANVRSPRDGKCLEYLGTYNPIANGFGEKLITLNIKVRFRHILPCQWVAQPDFSCLCPAD